MKTWTVWYRDPDGSLTDEFPSDEWNCLGKRRWAAFTRIPTRRLALTSPEVVTIPWTAVRKLTETEEGLADE